MSALLWGRVAQACHWADNDIAPLHVVPTVKRELGKLVRMHHRLHLDPASQLSRPLYSRKWILSLVRRVGIRPAYIPHRHKHGLGLVSKC
jgi:hypothetical protein